MNDIAKEEVTPPKRSDWWVTENLRTTPERAASVNRLIDMLTYKRVAWSKTERKFIHEFIKPVKGLKFDKFGNMHVRVGDIPIMWSSHTDSVHEKKGIQTVGFDVKEIGVAAEDTSGSQCLGADDAAGVWLMLEMLDEGVPGLYVFHREEEGGRKGSKWIVENDKKLLDGIKFAVALDRRSDDNFITHQMGERCCSEEWANSLIKLLNASGELNYRLDSTGSYTDTASYVDHIGECTNLSVGYKAAHSKYERLDLEFIFKLRDVLCSPEFVAGLKTLEPVRKPGEKEVKKYYGGTYYNGASHNYNNHKRWTKEEQEFWDEWGYNQGTHETSPMYGHNGYHHHSSTLYTPPKNNNGYGFVKRNSMAGTQSGTQVGHGVSKIAQIRGNGGNEANPDGTPETLLLPPPEPKGAVVPPDDDEASEHDTNYERLITLIKRNPEATLELLSTLIDDSPETIADILDAEGMTEKAFTDEILAMYGVVNC